MYRIRIKVQNHKDAKREVNYGAKRPISQDRAIIDALIRLLKTDTFDNITVQNILDETPVTRATFYAHFHDKYEVAERMQEMYVKMLQEIPIQMADVNRSRHPQMIHNSILQYQDIMQTLMQIRTDQADLRAVTAQVHKQHYLSQTVSTQKRKPTSMPRP